MYYKLVAVLGSRFARDYGICDSSDIKPGMEFTARGTAAEWTRACKIRQKVCIQSPVPVIHFCDSAVDVLLWYNKFVTEIGSRAQMCFYQIEPLTTVYREKSRDGTKFMQCGANKIKIVRMLTPQEVYDDALQEVANAYETVAARYPHINLARLMEIQKSRL